MVKSDQPFLNRVLMCRRLFFDNILSVLNFQKNFIENHNHLLKIHYLHSLRGKDEGNLLLVVYEQTLDLKFETDESALKTFSRCFYGI